MFLDDSTPADASPDPVSSLPGKLTQTLFTPCLPKAARALERGKQAHALLGCRREGRRLLSQVHGDICSQLCCLQLHYFGNCVFPHKESRHDMNQSCFVSPHDVSTRNRLVTILLARPPHSIASPAIPAALSDNPKTLGGASALLCPTVVVP